jgi:hypothetical protein
MANCEYCGKDMLQVNSCIEIEVMVKGKAYKPIPYGQETRVDFKAERCHDFNVEMGGYHHPGCDVEECPVCHGQIISCGCLEGEEEDGHN